MLQYIRSTRAPVPRDLDSVMTIRAESEIEPRSVGMRSDSVDHIWAAVRRLYATGLHPAIQVCIRRRGQVVLDRSIGFAYGNGPEDGPETAKRLCSPDTLFPLFSVSKPITAMVILLLEQRGQLSVSDRVADYVPGFARYGKGEITLEQVLTHRAGLPCLPPEAIDLNLSEAQVLELVCDSRPMWPPGERQGYNAVSCGFVLGEVAKVVTGRDIRSLLEGEILRPVGIHQLTYGQPNARQEELARSYFTGPELLPLAARLAERALGVELRRAVDLCNDPRFLHAILPAANAVGTARDASAFFQLLLNEGILGGTRVFTPFTVRRAVAERSHSLKDETIRLPMRYGMGFMLGGDTLGLFGPGSRHAFGHMGLMNVLCWADPSRQLAAAILTSGKPVVYPEIFKFYQILTRINHHARQLE